MVATTMEASSSSSSSSSSFSVSLRTVRSRAYQMGSTAGFVNPERGRSRGLILSNRRLRTPLALPETETVVEMGKSEITWQIIVGTIAGIIPFVVAGVEFSKRIIAQKRCEECRGTGLVFRNKKYFPCPQCGGFLPWQSWRRFFTG